MADVDTLIKQAMAAVKANQKGEARKLLEQVIAQDEYNEQAWLWLSGCVDTLNERITCLENVLTINPNNQKALKGMEVLKAQAAKGATPPTLPSVSPFSSDPFAGSGFEGAPPTSVEWGRGSAPAHGSGKQVQGPSAQEYDDWMKNLGFSAASSSTVPVDSGAARNDPYTFNPTYGPFSAPPFEYDDPYPPSTGRRSAPDAYGDYDYSQLGDQFNNLSSENAGYDGTRNTQSSTRNPYSGQYGRYDEQPVLNAVPSFGFGQEPTFEEPQFDDELPDLDALPDLPAERAGAARTEPARTEPFTFAESKPLARSKSAKPNILANAKAASAFGGEASAASRRKASPGGAPVSVLFKAIPAEIQAEARPRRDSRQFVGVLLLGALNIGSLILLILNLAG